MSVLVQYIIYYFFPFLNNYICFHITDYVTLNSVFLVLHFQDIFKQATEDRLTSANELPYFEGDFWPNVLEESIKELEQEEEERKKEENTASCETTEVSSRRKSKQDSQKGKLVIGKYPGAQTSLCSLWHIGFIILSSFCIKLSAATQAL